MKEITLQEIKKYATWKTFSIASALLLTVICVITACIFFALEGIGFVKEAIAVPTMCIFIIAMMISIISITYYEKIRNRLIEKVDTKSLRIFFEYFINVEKKDFVYYEVKDIFMYGLWKLKDRDQYLKYISETDSIEFNIEDISGKINKKEFLASSIFRCLTFHKDDIIYRNQFIFLDQEKFVKIIKAYAEVYVEEKNHTLEYVNKCKEIEEKYYDDKLFAKNNYKGLSKKVGKVEQFINFSNNPIAVKCLKKVLVAMAIVGLFIQPFNESTNRLVTILFNCITIILLLVDVVQKDEKNILQG